MNIRTNGRTGTPSDSDSKAHLKARKSRSNEVGITFVTSLLCSDMIHISRRRWIFPFQSQTISINSCNNSQRNFDEKDKKGNKIKKRPNFGPKHIIGRLHTSGRRQFSDGVFLSIFKKNKKFFTAGSTARLKLYHKKRKSLIFDFHPQSHAFFSFSSIYDSFFNQKHAMVAEIDVIFLKINDVNCHGWNQFQI